MLASPRIAYLDNGRVPDRVSGLPERFSALGLDVVSFRAYEGQFPDDPAAFAGVLLSGSAHGAYDDVDFIHREHDFIRVAAAAGTPMLGLCFGSQILASALCGRDQVFRRSTCEVGHVLLDMSEAAAADPLAGGLGPRVGMFVWHNDEVRAGHADMTILASTPACPNHVWRYRDRNVWGIQGHPELTRANRQAWIGKAADALRTDGADPDTLIRETEDSRGGLAMLGNFARVCLSGPS